jgi:hypothetical protein
MDDTDFTLVGRIKMSHRSGFNVIRLVEAGLQFSRRRHGGGGCRSRAGTGSHRMRAAGGQA